MNFLTSGAAMVGCGDGASQDRKNHPDTFSRPRVRYEKSGKKHVLLHDTSSIPVYVLSELLKMAETEEG